MNGTAWVDLVLVALLAAGALAGWRRGGFRLAGSVVGGLVGLVAGVSVARTVTVRADDPWIPLVTVLGVVLATALGAGIGGWLGGLPAAVLARLHLGLLDRAAGAVAGAVLAFVLVGVALVLAPTVTTWWPRAGGWLTTAEGSTVGSAATRAAGEALAAAPVRVPTPSAR